MAQQMGCGLKKNDLFELAIDSLGNEGEGGGMGSSWKADCEGDGNWTVKKIKG